MRPRCPAAFLLYPKIRFAFTDHPITVWAGAILPRLYVELIGVRTALAPRLVPFAKTSNNQIAAVDVLLTCGTGSLWARSGLNTSPATVAIRCSLAYWACRDSRRPIPCLLPQLHLPAHH